jgi:hypothetical protein
MDLTGFGECCIELTKRRDADRGNHDNSVGDAGERLPVGIGERGRRNDDQVGGPPK